MNTRSRATLFLIEQLIVIAVFAICAAACVKILTSAYFTANESRDTSNAILIAENGAEVFKAVSGDLGRTAEILGGVPANVDGSDAAVVYYDNHWRNCGEENASFRLKLTGGSPEQRSELLSPGDLTVEKLTGEQIVAFTVVARRAVG